MPELPEVETIARCLRPLLLGRAVLDVRIAWPGAVDRPAPADFTARLPGQRVDSVERRGKYLLLALGRKSGPADTLLIHLRMSGRLSLVSAAEPPPKHLRVCFVLDDGRELRFVDTRKFGRLYLVSDPAEIVGRLGPEPLADDFSADDLRRLCAGRARAIKPLLLEQTFIAGVGNIYADEALFRAGIDPRRSANSLDRERVGRLYVGLRAVLRQAIEHQGADLGDGVYGQGSQREHLQVYGREGKPCFACNTTIEKIRLSQRGTHFCPRCQT
ncbi:MAG: DNA-formamidopyrimidine glycosylase [Anaerolineae bacterium]|nr:DNA-formamidopyrimidine glycosylase [Anaerolineae bacterium]